MRGGCLEAGIDRPTRQSLAEAGGRRRARDLTTAERTSIITDFLAEHAYLLVGDKRRLMIVQLHDELGGELTIPQLKLAG